MNLEPTTWGTMTWLDLEVIFVRLLIALVCGAAVGFEREWRQRPAGLRTHMLMCLSACLLAILTIEIVHLPHLNSDDTRIDPLRLIEAVTAGVAFLAAGFIFFARGQVHGLTTGAGMWLAAGVGLAAGLGYLQIAGLATILALIVLWLLRHLEKPIDDVNPDEESTDGHGKQTARS